MSDRPYQAWLPCEMPEELENCKTPKEAAAVELKAAAARFGAVAPGLVERPEMGESYALREKGGIALIEGGERGLLYGAYDWIEALASAVWP